MNKLVLPRESGIIMTGATFPKVEFRIKQSIPDVELGVPTNLNLTGATIILKLGLSGSYNTFVELKSYHGITVTNALDGWFEIDEIQSLPWQKGLWTGVLVIKFPSGSMIPYFHVEITVS